MSAGLTAEVFLLCVGGFAAANLLRRGGGAAQIAVVTSEALLCVCVCVCGRGVCVCVWGGGQISPSGDQDDASCGRGATRSAPVGEHLRQESRLGLAAHQTGIGGRGCFFCQSRCRILPRHEGSCIGSWNRTSKLEPTHARMDSGRRRPRDEICPRATTGQKT